MFSKLYRPLYIVLFISVSKNTKKCIKIDQEIRELWSKIKWHIFWFTVYTCVSHCYLGTRSSGTKVRERISVYDAARLLK